MSCHIDSDSVTGQASGAGDDRVPLGEGNLDRAVGDSNAPSVVSGRGGDDVLDLGAYGGLFAIGDHGTFAVGATATGAGDDKIIGGTAGERFLVGDSLADNATAAGDDEIRGRGGDDTLFGDNVNVSATAPVGTAGGDDRLRGGTGNDTLRAGPADDFLDGGPQNDHCDGEAGTDSAVRCETVVNVP
ncbi:hypothetical protein [Streptomyces sp. NBC_01727]|uniref:calcium-binding protein n=1 Tax=unclassified Streptomyces TaxID=2593676 RepID=UPI002E157344|nr:hypothetical protein OIE76_03750 [Streptomyces sp. NBC_01727]